jgi:4-hydroxyphenylpyruvate dioxygenase
MALEPLGIVRLEALHYYVHDLERSRRFYRERMDFAEIGISSPQLTRDGRQRSAVFEAGAARVVCSAPAGEGGRAWRWLRKHPDGVGTLVFEVEDAGRAFQLLEERGGTPITSASSNGAATAGSTRGSIGWRSRRAGATPSTSWASTTSPPTSRP